jgi:hypothetical protein
MNVASDEHARDRTEQVLDHMLNIGKSGNALSGYTEVHPKLRRGDSGNLLAVFASS